MPHRLWQFSTSFDTSIGNREGDLGSPNRAVLADRMPKEAIGFSLGAA
jgi:hypothetical protein